MAFIQWRQSFKRKDFGLLTNRNIVFFCLNGPRNLFIDTVTEGRVQPINTISF